MVFQLTKTNFVFDLVSADWDCSRTFSGLFFRRNGFISPLPAFQTTSKPRQDFFNPYVVPSYVK